MSSFAHVPPPHGESGEPPRGIEPNPMGDDGLSPRGDEQLKKSPKPRAESLNIDDAEPTSAEMTSFLGGHHACWGIVVSYINDYSTICSVALVSKRFKELALPLIQYLRKCVRSNKDIEVAAKEWCADEQTVETKYGPISKWDVSL